MADHVAEREVATDEQGVARRTEARQEDAHRQEAASPLHAIALDAHAPALTRAIATPRLPRRLSQLPSDVESLLR